MPRQARKTSGTGIYHVMLRGINRQDIFEDNEDYMKFLQSLHQLVECYDERGYRVASLCHFYAYCLMPNHVHLLIQEKTVAIGEIVKRITISYAYHFNKKYQRNSKSSNRSENRPHIYRSNMSKTKNIPPKALIFSDFCCTFAMSLMILLVLICSIKVSEKSDMAKS